MAVKIEPLPTLAKFGIGAVVVFDGELSDTTYQSVPPTAHVITTDDLISLTRQIHELAAAGAVEV